MISSRFQICLVHLFKCVWRPRFSLDSPNSSRYTGLTATLRSQCRYQPVAAALSCQILTVHFWTQEANKENKQQIGIFLVFGFGTHSFIVSVNLLNLIWSGPNSRKIMWKLDLHFQSSPNRNLTNENANELTVNILIENHQLKLHISFCFLWKKISLCSQNLLFAFTSTSERIYKHATLANKSGFLNWSSIWRTESYRITPTTV